MAADPHRTAQYTGPTRRNGFELGDAVRLPNIDCTFEVVGLDDESLVTLRAPTGRTIRAGWRVLTKIRKRNQHEDQLHQHHEP